MEFENGFGKFACVGDTIRQTIPGVWGLAFVAELRYDFDSKPTGYDCYTPEQIADWKADKWHYVGVVVSVQWEGMEIDSDSLWGCECNLGDDNYGLNYVANELLAELSERVREKLEGMLVRLANVVETFPANRE